jgi:hypothetical protein
MPITKAKFKEQYEHALARVGQLKELGKTDAEIIETLSQEKFYMAVISKIFKMSGRQLAATKVEEDAKLAEKTIAEKKDARKPIREKEIEDAAWFHNLLHDLGKHVFTKMVKFVEWGDQDMNDYEKARAKLCNFVDSVQALIEDSGKIERLEDEKALLEMTLIKYQHVLAVAVKRVELLKWYNDMLIGVMTPEVRLRALNQMIAASAIKVMPEGMAKAEVGVPTVD